MIIMLRHADRHGAREAVESYTSRSRDSQKTETLGWTLAYETSKPILNDTLPPTPANPFK